MPFFSIIIPTCNRNDMLALCLDRLASGVQTLDASAYEVIVSDDGKNFDAKTLVEQQYPWVKWVAGPKCGPAANRNNGAHYAIGEWLVFTDDDCLPNANWLWEYKRGIEQYPDCQAFEGAILPNDWSLLKKDMSECPVNDKGGCFWSANIMVKKNLFEKIAGFDEQFKVAAQEDQDLFIRLENQTATFFIASAIVIHPVRIISLRKKIRSIKEHYPNWIMFYKKYNPGPIDKKLRSNIYDYLKIAGKQLLQLKLQSFILSIYRSFFSCYLLISHLNKSKQQPSVE